jgi:hypothetical protein
MRTDEFFDCIDEILELAAAEDPRTREEHRWARQIERWQELANRWREEEKRDPTWD